MCAELSSMQHRYSITPLLQHSNPKRLTYNYKQKREGEPFPLLPIEQSPHNPDYVPVPLSRLFNCFLAQW